METFWQDLRYAVRMLYKNSGWTAITVIALALGIGANTAIFSVVNAVLLRPLPYLEPDRLVSVGSKRPKSPGTLSALSYPDFQDYKHHNQVLEGLAAYFDMDCTLTGLGNPLHLNGEMVSSDVFTLLGVNPNLGRTFLPKEETLQGTEQGCPVIISYEIWQRIFGSDEKAVGRSVVLDGKPVVIIGVMPAGFQFPIQAQPPQLWTTTAFSAKPKDGETPWTEERGYHSIRAIGRLKPNVTLEQANADLGTIAKSLEQQYPETNTGFGIALRPLQEWLVQGVRQALLLMFAVVVGVLLITCANIANLLLARTLTRQKEMALRVALGANHFRILRQLLTESLLLSCVGGLAGLLLAVWGIQFLVVLIPKDVPRLTEISLDGRVFLFTLVVSIVTGIVFGLSPALYAIKPDLVKTIRDGQRGSTESGPSLKIRRILVVSEIAITLVVLISAGLLLTSFIRLQQVNPGFNPENLLTAQFDFPESKYPDPKKNVEFYQQLRTRLESIPGVTSVSGILPLPLAGGNWGTGFNISGRSEKNGGSKYAHHTNFRVIDSGYFHTMAIPLLKGRDLNEHDDSRSVPVVMVNEAFVRQFFPNEEPLGQRIDPSASVFEDVPPMREIVGVVGNVRFHHLDREPEPEVYVPYAQAPFGVTLVIRTKVDPRGIVTSVEGVMREMDKDIPIYNVKTMEQCLGATIAGARFNTLLIGIFALVALVLTIVGLYGVMAYTVTQRTQEIGIRMALGAHQGSVFRLILKQGMGLAGLGLLIGLLASLAVTRLMVSLLFGIQATDPMTFLMVTVLLTAVALLACVIPARRATKVDPIVALRYE